MLYRIPYYVVRRGTRRIVGRGHVPFDPDYSGTVKPPRVPAINKNDKRRCVNAAVTPDRGMTSLRNSAARGNRARIAQRSAGIALNVSGATAPGAGTGPDIFKQK